MPGSCPRLSESAPTASGTASATSRRCGSSGCCATGGDAEAFHADTWEAALTGRSDVPDAARERIVAAAVDLFAARGYGDVAVSDVATRAGTAKGSVYRHFESKEALFAAAVESVVAGVVGDLRAAADRAGGQLEPPAAMVTLVMSATPGFMLLLELTAGSLRGQPGHRELADAALTCFVDGVGPVLSGPGTPRERAVALIAQLARETMRAVLGTA
jgi:AcrR family transcriptional regulator